MAMARTHWAAATYVHHVQGSHPAERGGCCGVVTYYKGYNRDGGREVAGPERGADIIVILIRGLWVRCLIIIKIKI